MKTPKDIDLVFLAGFGPIVSDPAASRKFYCDALTLPFKEDTDGYLYTGGLDGVKYFALWPLAQARPALAWTYDLTIFPRHKPG